MIGFWARASLLALAAIALGATALAAQPYGPPEPIGQGGAPVPTPNYSANQRGSPFYVGPAVSTYGRRYPYGVATGRKPAKKR
jgi:hypothetical protein